MLAPDNGGGDGGSSDSGAGGEGSTTLLAGTSGQGSMGDMGAGGAGGESTPGFTNPDGTFSDGWLDRLPEEYADAKPTLSKYQSLPDLAKAHFHLQKKLGNPGIQVPTDKSGPDEIAAYRKAVGVPESADKYELLPEQMPEGVQANPELLKPYAEIAHRHNIPTAAMKELVAENLRQAGMVNEVMGGMVTQRLAEGEKQLREKFGSEYDTRVNMAKRAASVVGLDLTTHGLTDPNVVIALAQLGDMMSEDKLAQGDGNLPMAGKHRATDIMTNPQNPLYQKYQDGDTETAQLVARLLLQG